jgi:hypothetical protein
MARNAPDTRASVEIHELNREFLYLVRSAGDAGSAFGLDPAVRLRLVTLTVAQLEGIAKTPCLLAGFGRWPTGLGRPGVADGHAPALLRSDPHAEATRLFAATLLGWLWQTARRDRLLATLCTGPGSFAVDRLREAAFRDLQYAAAFATESLEARFCRHPRLWPDLVRSANQRDPTILVATRLSVVQLTLVGRPL